jgi:hypothetical protein
LNNDDNEVTAAGIKMPITMGRANIGITAITITKGVRITKVTVTSRHIVVGKCDRQTDRHMHVQTFNAFFVHAGA